MQIDSRAQPYNTLPKEHPHQAPAHILPSALEEDPRLIRLYEKQETATRMFQRQKHPMQQKLS